MKIKNETRYLVTDIVAIPITKNYLKSDIYREATGDGWGTVYTTNSSDELICSNDNSATLINAYGKQYCICPYEELNPKEWFKQAECKAIITTNDCGDSFYEAENGLIKIYVSYDENGFIDTWRLADWTETAIYDNEIQINFEDLPTVDPYN